MKTQTPHADAYEANIAKVSTPEQRSKLKVTTQIIRKYYVEYRGSNGGIYGGPFDTKVEAEACLAEAQQ